MFDMPLPDQPLRDLQEALAVAQADLEQTRSALAEAQDVLSERVAVLEELVPEVPAVPDVPPAVEAP